LFDAQHWFGDDMYAWIENDDGVAEWKVHEGTHYTFVFNTFVWLQLFNEINSRKCNDEKNYFVGILDNAWFVTIFIVSCGCQALMVELLGA
ncbi:cation transporting ATPase C-terminal domain-containing protein, partial [Clostridium perfringens]